MESGTSSCSFFYSKNFINRQKSFKTTVHGDIHVGRDSFKKIPKGGSTSKDVFGGGGRMPLPPPFEALVGYFEDYF